MAGERKITVSFDGKDVGLKKAAEKAADDIDDAGDKIKDSFEGIGVDSGHRFSDGIGSSGVKDSVGSSFKDMGKIAGGFLVAELATQVTEWAGKGLSWLWDGTKLASDTQESMSKVDTVFGDSASAIHDFAANADKNFGLSERAALDATGTFGNMFTQLGLGTDVASSMSQGMVGLASDLASFHNADITEVIEAQSAAFRGEYDSLQKYVPTINAATVEQKALELTGKKTSDELTAQDKILATNALMHEGAGAAAGDFARTQESSANQQRIAAAEAENLQANLGEKLLPVTEAVTAAKRKLVEVLANDVIPWMTETGSKIQEKLGPALSEVKDKATEFWNALTTGMTEDEGTPIERVALSIRDAWQDLTDTYNTELKPAIEDLVAKGRELVEDIDWTTVWQELQPILAAAGGAFMSFMTMAITAIGTTIENITRFITKIQEMWREHESFRIIVTAIWEQVSSKVTSALNVMSGVMKLITAIMSGDWSAAWNAIKQIASNAWNSMTSEFRGISNTIRSIGGAMWNPISSGLSSVVSTVESQINRLIRAYNAIPFLPNVSTISTGPARSLSVNSIPKMAAGGVVTRPTLAWLAEAGQPEAVVPLDRAGQLGFGGGGGGVSQLVIGSDGSDVGQFLVEILRKAIRNNGGIDVVFA